MDSIIFKLDKALRVITGVAEARRPTPAIGLVDGALDQSERRHSAGLMRVNHVGEVCAQALYDGQSQFARSEHLKAQFIRAGREEEDHLAWTAERLAELGARPSIFNPLWYAGAYLLGAVAARIGDAQSLGFAVETERQVEAHLAGHLQSLSVQDIKSRAIVEQMRVDEMAHGAEAQAMGAAEMPTPIKKIMQSAAKVMTTTSYYL